jgi:hypothetical protein
VPIKLDDDDPDPVDVGVRMLVAFHRHVVAEGPVAVVAVELPFSGVELHDPDTGEVLDEKLSGVIDLVVREHDHNVVVEHKTAARKWSRDQLDQDLQLTAYQVAARDIGLGEVGLRYQVVTKAKLPVVQAESVVRDRLAEVDFMRTATGVLRAIGAGAFWPTRGWACGQCPYAHACSGSLAVMQGRSWRMVPVRVPEAQAPFFTLPGSAGGEFVSLLWNWGSSVTVTGRDVLDLLTSAATVVLMRGAGWQAHDATWSCAGHDLPCSRHGSAAHRDGATSGINAGVACFFAAAWVVGQVGAARGDRAGSNRSRTWTSRLFARSTSESIVRLTPRSTRWRYLIETSSLSASWAWVSPRSRRSSAMRRPTCSVTCSGVARRTRATVCRKGWT